jgi:ribosomal protein S18 acetylase RimI-like enzyme
MIRPYREQDAPLLARIHNAAYPQMTLSAAGFHEFMAGTIASGGRSWVLAEPQLTGFATVSTVPGLDGIGDLFGCIAPEQQRRGLGSKLLRFLLEDLQQSDFRQISHYVTDLNSPAAHFLRHHNFFVEHEEWQLALNDLRQLPDPSAGQAFHLQAYSKQTAVPLFCKLYDETFAPLPWYQPFTPSEITSTLSDSRDIQFLIRADEPVGFAWIHLDADGLGSIEPLGIQPARQHQGLGRSLILLALHELKRRGAKRAEIGAWRDNLAALHLYESLGFRHQATITYLAYNLRRERN